MKRLILMLALSIITLQATWAKLNVTQETDGTVVFTLEETGDINNEFTNKGYALYEASSLITPYLNATKLKVVTKPGVTMSSEDLKRICGMAEEENNFPNLNTLDLEFANFTNDDNLIYLSYMDELKTITFPRTTTKIPQYCLTNGKCKIKHVIIPDNDTRSVKVGAQAFGQSLESIKLGKVDKNGNSQLLQYAFERCTNLTSVDFGTGWKEIGTNAFFGCSALKDIVLPEGVEYIRNGAFNGAAIEAIHLPNTLKVIEKNAFVCENLKTITIPASVEKIEAQAFQQNKALTDVYVLGTKTKAENQAFYQHASASFIYTNPSGTTPLKREFYKKEDESNSPLAMLHYPKEAKNDYVNEHSRTLGGTTNSMLAENGEIWPTQEVGEYTVQHGDYAGWKNFALVGENKQDETWDDNKRVDGKWYTMCLPFDMTAQQLKSAYGSKVEVVEFSDVNVVTKPNNDKIVTLKFKQPVTETKAHHPYMIHPSLHKGTQSGVKTTIVGIKKQEEKQESLDAQKVEKTADGVTYTFIGNYENAKHLQQYSYYYYSGDETQYKNGFYKWIKSGSGTWTPYTACVLMNKDNGANAKPSVSYYLESIDGQTTAIDTLPVMPAVRDMQQGKVYTITGQLVQQGALDLKALPQGLYIVNGKKYIVR
ncbi:MAG: leucine-rich repeat domain-containing protein [Prevotella sp.]|uniref:leucine-rich repeat domain-containing protein n=1 Tax=Prevotella sp. TaxID=59823 RepID=UPI001CADE7C4|nr:leucine-rich repeat domain-containing protein [Prevotella sp.]MBF1582326.1 leucine-rich repeat domain-containing protein [Prevotella sp.]MBF1598982.1 leucine-rich repeat domain-containing protein [Prevotella sp.]